MTSLVRVDSLLIVISVGDPVGLFFLYNSLNPLMIPFLSSGGGNCQDAVILVELFAVREKLVGGCEGTAIGKCNIF